MSVEGKLISQLNVKESLEDEDAFVIEDSNGNKQVKAKTILSHLSKIYTFNNIVSLKPSSDVNTIKSVLGSYASFKDAYDKNYTFLNINDTEKCLVNVSVGNGVVEFTYISIEFNDNNTNLMIYRKVTFSNNEWVACTDTDSYFFGKFIEEAPEDSKIYGRKNGEWVPVSGEDEYIPSEIYADTYINLKDIIGSTNIYGFYKLDDSGYYVITGNGVTKLDNNFKKIYEVKYGGIGGGRDYDASQSILTKIGSNIFIASMTGNYAVCMYNEDDLEIKGLSNNDNTVYYCSIISKNDKLYQCQYYNNKDLYIYNSQGEFIKKVTNPDNSTMLTTHEGIIFTAKGRVFDFDTDTFKEDVITTPSNIDLGYLFENGFIINKYNYGYELIEGSKNNKWERIDYASTICLAINYNYSTIVYTKVYKFIFRYPYGLSNPISLDYMKEGISIKNDNIYRSSLYKNIVYTCYKNGILRIEDLRKYGAD